MSNNSVSYFLFDSHSASVNNFTIRTGIFQSGTPITGTNYYFYSKQAHNARKARYNGHIWLKQDSELV